MKRLACAAMVISVSAGCGLLAPEEFEGNPHLVFEAFTQSSPPNQTPIPARLGVFWNPNGTAEFTFDELVEQATVSIPIEFPGPFEWEVTEYPKAEHMALTPGGRRYAIGRVYAYQDANEDGARNPGETMLAPLSIQALFFAPQDLPADDSPTRIAIPKGYRVIGLPLYCEPRTGPAHDGECGVPLGAACTGDEGCNGGTCLSAPPVPGSFPFAGGYCAIAETAETTCRPAGGALWWNHRDQTRQFWMQACTQDADCTRGDLYRCDYSRGACMPRLMNLFQPATGTIPTPTCLAAP